MAESLQLTTIYLVDIVGSTRLATSVGPVRWDLLREELFALLRGAIEATGGQEFRNTGDGLMVMFSSATAGVRCAVLTHQLLERRNRGAEQPLHVRIGLGTAESLVKDGEYFGMAAVEAARLCDKAPPDGILVSPATRMLAGRVEGARFESAGELDLKGIPEPMEASSVSWEPLDPERSGSDVGRWPLPEPLRTVPRVAFVGRESERGLLEHARQQACAGMRQVVLLSGEPGIGKTRLASYAALSAHASGVAVCWGACSEDLAAPYEPWIEVCSQLVEHADVPVLGRYVERFGGEVGRLARNLSRRLPDAPAPQSSDPETERFLLFKAVPELLRTVADSVPLCVVLDDFHWADGQSVALLKHVARNLEHGALQVLVTYRDSDLTKAHPLTGTLADLRRIEGVERIALTGFDSDQVAQLLSAAAGHDLDAGGLLLAGDLAAETGGNPFFVGEMVRSLVESGAITFDEGSARWTVDRAAVTSLPESVRDVIERRIDRLGVDAREVLTVASVIGRSFDTRLLAELVDMPEAGLLDELEAAVGAALLRESTERVGRFTFEHALINHTLYQGLGGTRRARLHHRVAQTLEALHGTDSEEQLADLAMHWRLATVTVDTTRAAAYSIRAGRQALDRLSPSDAGKLFEDALELLGADDTVGRCEALIGLGEAQRLTGDAAYGQTLLDACRIGSELGDGERTARAALANSLGRPSAFGRVDERRVAAIERALELDSDPERRAMLLSQQALELTYEHDQGRRRALAEQALALARDIGNPRTTARVVTGYFWAYWAPDGLALRRAHLAELLASAEAAGDPALEFWAVSAALSTMVESGELDRAANAAARMLAIAERVGAPNLRWRAKWAASACMAGLRGELSMAERFTEEAFQIGSQAGEPDAGNVHSVQLGLVRLFRGGAGEMLEVAERFVAALPWVPVFRALHAWALCWRDRTADAALLVRQAAADRFEHVDWGTTRLIALALYADAAAQTGVTGAAEILYELIAPWADHVVGNPAWYYGRAETYLGLLAAALGRDEQADHHFARSIDIHERDGMLVSLTRAHLGWAEALAARGATERARGQAERVLALAHEHGYGLFAPRAEAILGARSGVG